MRKYLLIIATISFLQLNAQVKPFYSAEKRLYGYSDGEGRVVVTPKYDLAYSFSEGLAAVRAGGKYGFVNEKGVEIVPPAYDFTWCFRGGYAAVMVDGKYGFINLAGKEVVHPMYEEANNYHGDCCYKGLAHVKENGKWKIIRLPKN